MTGCSVAAMQVQLVRDDLFEEAAIVQPGQGIGHHHLPELDLRGFELRVGAFELLGHVLECHQLHAEGGHEIQREFDEERVRECRPVARHRRQCHPRGGERGDGQRAPTTAAPSILTLRSILAWPMPAIAKAIAVNAYPDT